MHMFGVIWQKAALLVVLSLWNVCGQIPVPLTDDVCSEANTACFSGSCTNCLVAYRAQTDDVQIAVRGDIPGATGYVAFGLSKSGGMGDSSVMACISNSGVTVNNYYNDPRSTGPAADPTLGLTVSDAILDGSTVHCSFARDINITSHTNEIFPLDQAYSLLLGSGPLSGGQVTYHSATPTISSSPQDITQNSGSVGSASVSPMKKAHACLMITAWVLSASIGIIMARFYKANWASSTLCKEKVWFAIHRFCMVLTLLLTVAAFIIIFVDVEGYSNIPSSAEGYKRAHPPLGIVVTGLVLTNPIMAIFRPHPGTKNRPIFNWAHWFVGTSAYILSVFTVFFGMTLSSAQDFAPIELRYVMAAYVALTVLTIIILEVLKCVDKRGESNIASDKSQEGQEKDMQMEMEQSGVRPENPATNDTKCETARVYLVVFYTFCTAGLWLGMILIIGLEL